MYIYLIRTIIFSHTKSLKNLLFFSHEFFIFHFLTFISTSKNLSTEHSHNFAIPSKTRKNTFSYLRLHLPLNYELNAKRSKKNLFFFSLFYTKQLKYINNDLIYLKITSQKRCQKIWKPINNKLGLRILGISRMII